MGELVDIAKGRKPSRILAEEAPGSVRLLQIDDLRPEAVLKYAPSERGMVYAVPEDIIIAWDGANAGTSNFGLSGAIGSTLARLRPRSRNVDTGFLGHFVRASQSHLREKAKGATVPHLDPEVLRSLVLALPSLPDQRRIAAILDQADALRAKRRAALTQFDGMARAIFVEMFGDPAGNPRQWPTASLGELITKGPQNGLYKPSSDYGSGTPIVRIDAFYDGRITKLASLRRLRISSEDQMLFGLRPGDVLINRVNSLEYLGKSALVPELPECTVFESNMMRLSVDRARVLPEYVIQFLQSPFIKQQILASAKNAVNQSSINQHDVRSLRLFVPPMALQALYVERIAELDESVERQRRSATELDALFTSLQHRAFRGEL
nr:restriction endonuclease subunit S [Neoroseomonas oryzicola]